MKHITPLARLVTPLALVLITAPAFAQPGVMHLVSRVIPQRLTVAQLPTADGTQGIRQVTDGDDGEDCDTGGGTTDVICADLDGTWTSISAGGGGGGGATTEAALETQLTDVSDVFTNNDGALADDDLSDNQVGDLTDVSETGADSGEALVSDGAGAWAPSTAAVCLSDGTNCADPTGAASSGELIFDNAGSVDGVTGSSVSASEVTLDGDLRVNDALILTDGASTYTLSLLSSNRLFVGGKYVFDSTRFYANSGSGAAMMNEAVGLATRPSWSFFTDGDTGIGWAGANQMSLVAGGAEIARLSANGLDLQDPGTRPTCDSSTRGNIFRNEGTTGVDDSLASCEKRVDDSYAWEEVDTTGTHAATCADSGDGNPGTLTLTPITSYVELTNSDSDGCTVTMGETGVDEGVNVEIVIVSNAGGTVDFADTTGVTELAGAFNAALYDSLSLRYIGDRYIETTRSNN